MSEVIEVENDNVKALYLRGKAYLHKNEYSKAQADFKLALSIEPENQIIANYC